MNILIGSSSYAHAAAKSARARLVGRPGSPGTPSLSVEPAEEPQSPPKWCGKYCIAQRDYTRHVTHLGRKALKRVWIQKGLGDRLHVEPSASVPFGTLRELIGHHHENTSINAVVTHRLKASAELDPDAQRLEWASQLRMCRDAFYGLKIPQLMQTDLLDAMFRQHMTVPTHRTCWDRFRQDLAGAYAQLFYPAVLQSVSCSPLDVPVSLLVKDIGVREYDFSVSINSQESGSLTASTVQLPLPGFGRSHDTRAVVLDGVEVPDTLRLHHAEAKGMMDPPKPTSWEGDNMMLVPFYKEHVYKTLVSSAQTALAAFEGNMALDGIQLTGYMKPNMQIFIEDLQLSQSECDTLEGTDLLRTASVNV